ncbi:MAG: sterol desaturase family protein [Caulobacteraceae bacterium]
MHIGDLVRHVRDAPWLLVFLAALVVERVVPGRPDQKGDWWNNARVWVLGILAGLTTTPLAGGLATLVVNAMGGGWIRLPDRGAGLLLGLAVYLAAMDLGEYLFHRAQHAIPALWAMHSLHHSDPAVNVATTSRHFWLEAAIKSLTIWLAVGLIFKASPTIVVLYGFIGLYNLVLHANVRVGLGRFSFLVNSPQYHRLHHSRDPAHFNRNFAALLSVWDVLTGAYRAPQPGEFPDTGLADRPAPSSFWEALAWPLARSRWLRAEGERQPATLPL